MPTITMTKGLPGSGKSTWAKRYVGEHPGVVRVNNDDLRMSMFGVDFDSKFEDAIGRARRALIESAMGAHADIVVDNCNLSQKADREVRRLAKAYGYDVKVQDFTHLSLDTCLRRDAARPNPVGHKVIRRMYDDFLAPKPITYAPPPNAREAIICDLDGTLALFCKRKHCGCELPHRSPYSQTEYSFDALNPTVSSFILDQVDRLDRDLIIVTGREETDAVRRATVLWLNNHGVPWEHVYMRPEGDHREDSIVKRETFNKYIRDTYNVKLVLDDRDRVVNMWRSLGLQCWQVADGNF